MYTYVWFVVNYLAYMITKMAHEYNDNNSFRELCWEMCAVLMQQYPSTVVRSPLSLAAMSSDRRVSWQRKNDYMEFSPWLAIGGVQPDIKEIQSRRTRTQPASRHWVIVRVVNLKIYRINESGDADDDDDDEILWWCPISIIILTVSVVAAEGSELILGYSLSSVCRSWILGSHWMVVNKRRRLLEKWEEMLYRRRFLRHRGTPSYSNYYLSLS